MENTTKCMIFSSLIFGTGLLVGRLTKKTPKINYGGEIVINIHEDSPADVYLAVKDTKVLEDNDYVYLKIKKVTAPKTTPIMRSKNK